MISIEAVVGGLRKIATMDQRLGDLADKVDQLDAKVDDVDRRLIRLETVVQIATGTALPPLSPRMLR